MRTLSLNGRLFQRFGEEDMQPIFPSEAQKCRKLESGLEIATCATRIGEALNSIQSVIGLAKAVLA